MRAIVFYEQGKQDLATGILRETLQLAIAEDYRRVFIDHGTQLSALLEATAEGINEPHLLGYTNELLAAIMPSEYASYIAPGDTGRTLIEPLSDRELEVLSLLSSSLSSTEMASELSISVNTLRSHLKNIYTKLDAHSRYEAIARAKTAGLL
jgi:LuxR family maltose regulon positive regulatory protein